MPLTAHDSPAEMSDNAHRWCSHRRHWQPAEGGTWLAIGHPCGLRVDRRVRALFDTEREMRIENTEKAKVFNIFDAPKLDPITVVLQDVGPGCGRLVVECFGSAWSGYWGAMGDRTLLEFLADCHPGYIAEKMHPTDRKLKKSEAEYMGRIVEAVHSALRSNVEFSGGGAVPPSAGPQG